MDEILPIYATETLIISRFRMTITEIVKFCKALKLTFPIFSN
jgi:hypothetical protein